MQDSNIPFLFTKRSLWILATEYPTRRASPPFAICVKMKDDFRTCLEIVSTVLPVLRGHHRFSSYHISLQSRGSGYGVTIDIFARSMKGSSGLSRSIFGATGFQKIITSCLSMVRLRGCSRDPPEQKKTSGGLFILFSPSA